jgi:hypothetical protein
MKQEGQSKALGIQLARIVGALAEAWMVGVLMRGCSSPMERALQQRDASTFVEPGLSSDWDKMILERE